MPMKPTMTDTAALALGLAALGRPGYITLGHAEDLADGTSVAAMEARCHAVLDAAWAVGVRWFDAARSYGRAEAFLASWLAARAIAPDAVTVSSKWGYRYEAGWAAVAAHHEIKDHSRAALERQLVESRALLGAHLSLYQVHSVTPDSPLLDDAAALDRLGELRDGGLPLGLSVSGPRQGETIDRALAVTVAGRPLWTSVQATWNLLERSAEPALRRAKASGLRVLVKEAVANGRLAPRGAPEALRRAAARLGVGPDAVAIAAACAQPFVDVVLSGAATPAQLAENVRARQVDGAAAGAALAELVEPPEAYWRTRAQLAWN
jgi:aryl-alcohol dehydrogenase-like predicted oxidoreductase